MVTAVNREELYIGLSFGFNDLVMKLIFFKLLFGSIFLNFSLNAFCDNAGEKIFVHTDRENYLSGEMIWFKAYSVNGESKKLSSISKIAYIEILDDENKVLVQRSVKLVGGTGDGSLYIPLTIRTGGYKLRCYTRWMRNTPPEMYFEKFLSIINAFTPVDKRLINTDSTNSDSMIRALKSVNSESKNKLRITGSRDEYSKREKVILKIGNEPESKNPLNFSISVSKVDSLDKFKNHGIHEYFNMPVFPALIKESREDVPEYEGQMITGYVETCNGELGRGLTIFLYDKGGNVIIYASKTNDEGRFLFVTSEFIPSPSVLIKSENPDNCFKIELDESYSDEYSSFKIPSFSISENDLKEISRRSVYTQVRSALGNRFTQLDTVNYSNFFESGYEEYRLDDYTRFHSIETTFREYVSQISVRTRKEKLFFRVRSSSGQFYNADPLILIDGTVVDDHSLLQTINPNKIEKIFIERELYLIGESTFYGAIGLFTKPGEKISFKNPNEYRLPINQEIRAPFFPKYLTDEEKNSPKPDLRTLLYWNPKIVIEENIKEVQFYTSDVPGIYKGVVQGICEDGEAVYQEFTFEVK